MSDSAITLPEELAKTIEDLWFLQNNKIKSDSMLRLLAAHGKDIENTSDPGLKGALGLFAVAAGCLIIAISVLVKLNLATDTTYRPTWSSQQEEDPVTHKKRIVVSSYQEKDEEVVTDKMGSGVSSALMIFFFVWFLAACYYVYKLMQLNGFQLNVLYPDKSGLTWRLTPSFVITLGGFFLALTLLLKYQHVGDTLVYVFVPLLGVTLAGMVGLGASVVVANKFESIGEVTFTSQELKDVIDVTKNYNLRNKGVLSRASSGSRTIRSLGAAHPAAPSAPAATPAATPAAPAGTAAAAATAALAAIAAGGRT